MTSELGALVLVGMTHFASKADPGTGFETPPSAFEFNDRSIAEDMLRESKLVVAVVND